MTPATEKAAPIPAEGQPTDAMVEAAAKAIHDHWQNGPGPHARTWEKCCRDLPGAAADFRAKARAGLVAALMQDRADRASQEERIREDEREALARHMAAEYAQHETGYDWELTDRIWQDSWRKAADRALAAMDRARLRGGAS